MASEITFETTTVFKTFNKYRLGRMLGKGTYGCVYEATNESFQEFALKQMKTKDMDDEILFENEVTILEELCSGKRHPNIVGLVDVYRESYLSTMVFELAECDLGVFLTRLTCDLSKETIKSFAHQLLSAISFCHSKRIVHGDIKPMNILTFKNGSQIKLGDFGAANASSVTKRKYPGCTYVYAPPEQFLSQLYVANEALDMWSYGMTVLEICRRKRLIRMSDSEQEILLYIFKQFGTPTRESWPEAAMQLEKCGDTFPKSSAQPLKGFDEGLGVCGLNLVNKILVLDPSKRWDARSCLQHEFFSPGDSSEEKDVSPPSKRRRIA